MSYGRSWRPRGSTGTTRVTWRSPVVRTHCPDGGPFVDAGTAPGLWESYDELIRAGRWGRRRGVGQDHDGPGRSPARDCQAAGWLKVATNRPNASMWSRIEKATTAPRVVEKAPVCGRPRLGTSSANTDNR